MTRRRPDTLALFRAGLSGAIDPKAFNAMLDSIEVRAGAPSYFTVPPELLTEEFCQPLKGGRAKAAEEPGDG